MLAAQHFLGNGEIPILIFAVVKAQGKSQVKKQAEFCQVDRMGITIFRNRHS